MPFCFQADPTGISRAVKTQRFAFEVDFEKHFRDHSRLRYVSR
jgi:hypothetical protein